MRVKDREIEKVNKHSVKRLEPILDSIDRYEEALIKEFNDNLSKIFGNSLIPIFDEIAKTPNLESIKTRTLLVDGQKFVVPYNILQDFHKSYISDPDLRNEYERRLKKWFSSKTEQLKSAIVDKDSYPDLIRITAPTYALASLALTSFHKKPRMILRDVQKMTGIVISEGDIAELSAGEGKTLSAVLPVFLQSLRGKGVHVITSNGYLSKRDYEETLPIYEGLGVSSGYIPSNEEELADLEGKDISKLDQKGIIDLSNRLKTIKQESYRKDISFGSKETFAFDYLRDSLIKKKEDLLQREDKPGFALIDEIDDALIDDAQIPYRIAVATPMYKPNMSLKDLCVTQGLSYEDTLQKVNTFITDAEHLTYEEARYISNMYGNHDLLADPSKYQEAADRFFRLKKVYVTKDNMFGFKTSKDVYRALLDEDVYDAQAIRSKYGIIYCSELQDYKISDKCYEEFLKYCYFSFHINSQLVKYYKQIRTDKNYEFGRDYYVTPVGKYLRLTTKGANRILNDPNYPDFVDDYNRYMSSVKSESATVFHYFNQAVTAHLLMKPGEDYIVEDGKIKVLKNGRIQEGSTYSNGLHQALELKEGIIPENRTKETTTSSSITQKEFYSRYDLFSGMTGTSSKSLFGEIFGKGTVEVPKHAFYSFYGRRKIKDAKEPLGVEKKDTVFSLNLDDKVNLIINSIIDSQRSKPNQPVLLVVSDYSEIKLFEEALKKRNMDFNTLTATTSKEDEALIIAQAGLPGAITISTEMAGRGTDIKVGGDRDTIIDIATERHIRMLEQKQGVVLNLSPSDRVFLREKVEKALSNKLWTIQEEETNRKYLDKLGLKVISSGFFDMKRVDRQLEGRTGRNGISGVCERYAYPEDLKRMGISSFNFKDSLEDTLSKFKRNPDGKLEIDEKSYNAIVEKIETIQKTKENEIKERIKDSQQLNNYSTKLIEEYREKRRKIICNQVDTEKVIQSMIEDVTDGIISSYILDKELKKKALLEPLNKSGLKIDVTAISLEVKQVLGISFDPSVVDKSNINLLELRDAIIRTAKERRKAIPKENDNRALLAHNDYMIANIPEILEKSFSVKSLVSISTGFENQKEALANIKFFDTKRKLLYESYRQGLKLSMGIPLSKEEFKILERRKKQLFELIVKESENTEEYEIKEANYQENNINIVDRIKAIKKSLDEKDEKKMQQTQKQIEKGKDVDLKQLYSNLFVRPIKFLNTIIDGKKVTKLVIVKEPINQVSKDVKNTSSK